MGRHRKDEDTDLDYDFDREPEDDEEEDEDEETLEELDVDENGHVIEGRRKPRSREDEYEPDFDFEDRSY